MSLSTAAVARILGDQSITALIGQNLFPDYDPQLNHAYPMVVFKTENESQLYCSDGPGGFWEADLVLDCIGKTYADADKVVQAVLASLDGDSSQRHTWDATVNIQGCFLKDGGVEDSRVISAENEAVVAYLRTATFEMKFTLAT